jgi:hypothetical protein
MTIRDINIRKERRLLFHTFDEVFLKIFPNFIESFNALLKEDARVLPKKGELLNTDLRIFALMRVGITDMEMIADILEYAIKTIYIYRMRTKANAYAPEIFEEAVMLIKGGDSVK